MECVQNCLETFKNCLSRIFCKILKISLFHVVFKLRREVTLGHLISDNFKMQF